MVCADARRDSFRRVDADGEIGAVGFAVTRDHRSKSESPELMFDRRHTHDAAAIANHHVDGLWRHHRRRRDQITFVLPVFIVGDDDKLAGGNIRDRGLNGIKGRLVGCCHDTMVRRTSRAIKKCQPACDAWWASQRRGTPALLGGPQTLARHWHVPWPRYRLTSGPEIDHVGFANRIAVSVASFRSVMNSLNEYGGRIVLGELSDLPSSLRFNTTRFLAHLVLRVPSQYRTHHIGRIGFFFLS